MMYSSLYEAFIYNKAKIYQIYDLNVIERDSWTMKNKDYI